MAKLSLVQGTTSKMIDVFLPDSASTTGAGKTGLVYNSAGMSCVYYREGAASTVSMTPTSTSTLGTWTSLGFKEIDSTGQPGMYQIGVPNLALAAGAKSVKIYIFATGVAPQIAEIELTAVDNQDAVRFGLSALPNGPMMVKKNQALANWPLIMRSATNHIDPVPGLTVTASRSIDGAAYGAGSITVAGLSGGTYVAQFAAGDLNGNNIMVKFSAATADDLYVLMMTQP